MIIPASPGYELMVPYSQFDCFAEIPVIAWEIKSTTKGPVTVPLLAHPIPSNATAAVGVVLFTPDSVLVDYSTGQIYVSGHEALEVLKERMGRAQSEAAQRKDVAEGEAA